MQLIATDKHSVIVGMGLTGMSVARYFYAQRESFVLMDTRLEPPESALESCKNMQQNFDRITVMLGELDEDVLCSAKQIVLSPGVSRNHPAIIKAQNAGVIITGDIDIFLGVIREKKQAKIIGVTGSNGKSTVVSLLGLVCEKAGLSVQVAGNIGVPVLDLLSSEVAAADVYVLELSSFQLELVNKARLDVACVLNVSPDHMDRYASLAHYCQAKLRIYFGAKKIVYNVQDILTIPPLMENIDRIGFSIDKPIEETQLPVYVDSTTDEIIIDKHAVMNINDVKIKGLHNANNALAVCALSFAAGIDSNAMVQALTEFEGLPHRCETVASANGITYINDSKATNVGSAVAAITGLKPQFQRIILIAGGDGKGADFNGLAGSINRHVFYVILIGKDAQAIKHALINDNSKTKAQVAELGTIELAVQHATKIAQSGDVVLLSPACASLDMFKNYEQRGEYFTLGVKAVMNV